MLVTGHPPVSGPLLLTEHQGIFQLEKPTSPFTRSEIEPHLVKIRMVAAPRYTTWKSGLLLSFFMVPWILFSLLKQWCSHSFSVWSISPKLSYCSYLSIPASCLTMSTNCPQALRLSWSHYLLCWLDQIHLLALLFRDKCQYLAHNSTIYRRVSADFSLQALASWRSPMTKTSLKWADIYL